MLIGTDHKNIQGSIQVQDATCITDRRDFAIDALARILAGYEQPTWDKLHTQTKLHYRRAANTLLISKNEIVEWMDKNVSV